MNITDLIRNVFAHRIRAFERYASEPGRIQEDVLRKLVAEAENTEWGKKYSYSSIKSSDDFSTGVPVNDYESLKPYVERMRHGEQNLIWPSKVDWYAQSSGTTNDKSKYIPVTAEGLKNIHYKGGADCVAVYLDINRESRFFSGKGLILGGSFNKEANPDGSRTGDLSAVLMQNINPLVNMIRVPSKEVALLSNWEEKIGRLAAGTMNEHVTNLSGVPSWMLVVIKKVLELKGVDTVEQVWPDLEVFFHGGVSFAPYREQYKSLIRSDRMHYVETYNASEGFFGIQTDLSDPSMMLMIDYDVYYEFIPMDEFGKEHPQTRKLTEVELGKNYAMLITTSCGLWRYMIGDTVMFTSRNPYKFKITGRTKHFINAQWLVEFSVMPDSVEHFASVLDDTLKAVNSDYEAKRTADIALQPLEVVVARKDLFHDWLASKGKLGGQHKVPRLSNGREYMDKLLEMNKS